VRRADNLATFMFRLSWNLRTSTFCNPQGLSRPVQGLLYLFTVFQVVTPSSLLTPNVWKEKRCLPFSTLNVEAAPSYQTLIHIKIHGVTYCEAVVLLPFWEPRISHRKILHPMAVSSWQCFLKNLERKINNLKKTKLVKHIKMDSVFSSWTLIEVCF